MCILKLIMMLPEVQTADSCFNAYHYACDGGGIKPDDMVCTILTDNLVRIVFC